MRYLVLALAIIGSPSFSLLKGQTANDYLESGIEQQNREKYKGAIKDFNKAIQADDKLMEAYFNRGIAKMAIGKFDAAVVDFNKTIELEKSNTEAYFNKAAAYLKMEKYSEAVPVLNALIEIDESYPNALFLRGQSHFILRNIKACCKDFQRAKELGDPSAGEFLTIYRCNERKGESFSLNWPENWKVLNKQENEKMIKTNLRRDSETLDSWTEAGLMQTIKNATSIAMDEVSNLMYESGKAVCPKINLIELEKDINAEYPWAFFRMECPSTKDSKTPESQLWYVVQGKTALYVNYRAIKESTIPEVKQEKWIDFFKTGEVVYLDEE